MSKTLTTLFIVMILVLIFCNIYETFVFKKRLWNDYMTERPLRIIEEYKDNMRYLVFINPKGGVYSVNYTLDSMDYEMHKKYDK